MATKGTKKARNLKRFPVLLGTFSRKVKKGGKEEEVTQKYYSSVTKDAIDALNLTIEDEATSKDGGVEVRGTKGAGSIKVTLGKKTAKGNLQYYSVPVPAWFKIKDMKTFVKDKIEAADQFVAPSGRTYGIKKSGT